MLTRRSVLAASLAAPALLATESRAQDARPVLRVAVQALPPTLEPIESISNIGLRITDNVFLGNRVAVRARQTARLAVSGNRWMDVDSLAVLRDTAGADVRDNIATQGDTLGPPPPSRYPSSPLTRRDRSAMIVDEWGPYDWRSPKLWPVAGDSTRAVPLRLAVLGPPGSWREVTRRGVATLSASAGRVGDTLIVTPAPDSVGNWDVTLEYRGAATVSPRGTRRGAGQPYRFSYGRFEPSITWNVRFLTASDTFAVALPRLDFMWYRPPASLARVPQEHWSLEATGNLDLPPGNYTLRTISDDAVRVWVDGALVIDDWDPHESKVDAVPLTAGRHALRVEYRQVDGWVEVRVEILRGEGRSTGSPGPH